MKSMLEVNRGCKFMNRNKHNVLLLIGSVLLVLIACMGTVSAAAIDDFAINPTKWTKGTPDLDVQITCKTAGVATACPPSAFIEGIYLSPDGTSTNAHRADDGTISVVGNTIQANFALSALPLVAAGNYHVGVLVTVPTPPTVNTLPATSVISSGAILNGRVNNLGTGTITAAYFNYKVQGTSDWETQLPVTAPGITFSETITGLTPETIYEVQACANTSTGNDCGDVQSFTTRPPAPEGKYTVIATGDQHVSITPSGQQYVDANSTVAFEMRTLPGSDYTDLTVNGKSEGAVSSYAFTVTGDTIIEATGKGTLGVVKPAFVVVSEGRRTFTFYDMSTGATEWSWDFGDGSRSTQPGPLTHTYQGTDCRYAVTLWVKDNYNSGTLTQYINVCDSQTEDFTITARAEHGGRITPFGEAQVKAGSEESYMIYPNNGYSIKSVFIDGNDIGPVPKYVFQDVNRDHTIRATFQWNA